jgi:hypothetical protein
MALVAFASIALVSCKNDKNTPEGGDSSSSDLKVVVNPKSADLVIGGSTKLRASLSPAKEGVTIKFASSDEAVATVGQDGIVKAIAEGKANIIVSAEGAASDTCVVTVSDPYNAFAWGDMGLFKLGSEAVSDEYEVTFSDGTTYHIKNYMGVFYVWDENIEYVSGSGLSGLGYITIVQVPVGIIQDECPEKGYYITSELNFDNSLPKDSAGVNPETYLGQDAEEWAKWLMDSTYYNDDIFVQPIHIWDMDDESGENDLYYLGYIHNGWIGSYSNGFFYHMNIVWFDYNYSYYFLKVAENEAGEWDFVSPYEFGDNIEKEYRNYEVSEEIAKPHMMKFVDLRNDEKVMMQLSKKAAMTERRMK